jgi:hypothetical protein
MRLQTILKIGSDDEKLNAKQLLAALKNGDKSKKRGISGMKVTCEVKERRLVNPPRSWAMPLAGAFAYQIMFHIK